MFVPVIEALVVLFFVWWLLERFGVGFGLGLLILGGLDALPGPNLERSVLNSITSQDLVVALLALVLLRENARERFWHLRKTREGRFLTWWCGLFSLWYGGTIIHTWMTTPVPLIHAVTFSRAFPYFAVLLPLLYGALSNEETRNTVLVTLAVGSIVAAIGQSVDVAAGASLSYIVHTYQTNNYSSGLTRLYTSASDLPFAALPLGYGLVLFGHTARLRILGGVLAVTGLGAIILGLTRAMYLGAFLGLTSATLITFFSTDARARIARSRALRSTIALLVAVLVIYLAVPSGVLSGTLVGVSKRATSLVAFIGSGTVDQSLNTRQREITGVEWAIRGRWLAGVGELDPTYDYQPAAPGGNVNQVDISLLGGVALIGIIGIALYSVPLFASLVALLNERWRRQEGDSDDWIAFGGVAWCVGAIVVSPTLGLFFNAAQTVGSAFVLALIGVFVASRRVRTPTD